MWGVLAAVLAVAAASPTDGQFRPAEAPPCYDALVMASIVRQTPTVMPDCEQCIWMAWPYIDYLDVKQIVRGHAPLGPLKALSIQHTYFVPSKARWWLRRNASGSFNVLSIEDKAKPVLCSNDDPPARPYIRPREGQTLDDLEREGDERYGHKDGVAVP